MYIFIRNKITMAIVEFQRRSRWKTSMAVTGATHYTRVGCETQ